MKGQISFSTLGNEFIHEIREKINISENKVDLTNNFSYTVTNFLNRVFENENFVVDADDITFDPQEKNNFKVSSNLMKVAIFKETWKKSDLPNVIKKFADSTYHRYLHLEKHLEKTQKKIRNH